MSAATKSRNKANNKRGSAADGEKAGGRMADLFRGAGADDSIDAHVFQYRKEMFVCDTDKRGFATPRNASPSELVLDASNGFIPLWAHGQTLRWRFQERSLARFADPMGVKALVRSLLGDALLLWGSFRPVAFSEQAHDWDFEVVVRERDRCSTRACVLASAFFPDAGRHELVVYPKMFAQPRTEQIETMAHEVGHIFGLRHFFAQVSERAWPSEVFGTHRPFSIMNYGHESEMTDADRHDLRALYESAWSGTLLDVNGTEIRLVKPCNAPLAETPPFEQGWDRVAARVAVLRCGS